MADGSSSEGGTIPIWGDGTAVRAYTYVDDLVEGVYMLMQADPARHPELVEEPGGMLAIIGGDEYVTVDEVAALTGDGDRGLRQGDQDRARGRAGGSRFA